MANMEKTLKACVTGGSGYVASWLIKKLLRKGYSVNATLLSLGDENKVGLLKSLATGCEAKLELYEADLYKPLTFEPAIRGCDFVFHIATLLEHVPESQCEDTIEAMLEATKSIMKTCIRAGSVKRLIYTSSVFAASPLKEDESGFKNSIDEACWSALNLPLPFSNPFLKAYLASKTLSEKTLLMNNEESNKKLEVVTLVCGLIGGDTLLPYVTESINVLLSTTRLPKDHEKRFEVLRHMEELLGKVPVIHIEDACEAHVFCMEQTSMCGRYLCASSYVQVSEIRECCGTMYPELLVEHGDLEESRDIRWGGTKLVEKGFVYKYDLKTTLEHSIKAAKRLGDQLT